MDRSMRKLLLGSYLLIAAMTSGLHAQEGFRIETDVFAEGVAKPLSQTLTLFQDGIAYDLPREENMDITMFDPRNNRLVRFSKQARLQTTLQISEMRQLMESARKQAESTELAVYLRGAEKVEATGDKVTVGDDTLRYETTLQRPSPSNSAETSAGAYRSFADAMILMNAFDGIPPFARLALNAAVEDQQAVPKEIRQSIQRGKKKRVYICRLHATWLLSKADRSRIAEIQEMLVSFPNVSQAEYMKQTQALKMAAKP
jgi:hypothetical protein